MQNNDISSEGIGVIRGIQVFILYNLSWITMEAAPVTTRTINLVYFPFHTQGLWL